MSLDTKTQLLDILALSAENEVVEFKEAKNGYDFTKLGKYFSALCNEANLKRQPAAWLVFGVNDQRQVVGFQLSFDAQGFRQPEGGNRKQDNQSHYLHRDSRGGARQRARGVV